MTNVGQEVAGTVDAVWRYPVKSMRGEQVDKAEVTAQGLVGDRAYALFDRESGRIASAKYPRKWARLFDCHATYALVPDSRAPSPVQITLPDGSTVTSAQPDRDTVLSLVFGREVTLTTTPPDDSAYEASWPAIEGVVPVGEPVPSTEGETMTVLPVAVAAPTGTFFDATPIHLLTTATLARLRALYPEGDFDVRRFRPNIVVELPDAEPGFTENTWVGRILGIGETARVHIVMPCPRCAMPTLSQGSELPRDVGILRTIARNNQQPVADLGNMGCAGVYAVVTRPGVIRPGDEVRLT